MEVLGNNGKEKNRRVTPKTGNTYLEPPTQPHCSDTQHEPRQMAKTGSRAHQRRHRSLTAHKATEGNPTAF